MGSFFNRAFKYFLLLDVFLSSQSFSQKQDSSDTLDQQNSVVQRYTDEGTPLFEDGFLQALSDAGWPNVVLDHKNFMGNSTSKG